MRATDKQCRYLNALAKRVERIKSRYPGLVDVSDRDWFKERELGMTADDASIRITAYHSLILGLRMKIDLLGL